MKRVGNLMPQIASLDNLYLAYQKAIKGKQCKKEVLEFAKHFDDNIQEMQLMIMNGTISVGDYRYFTIYDPKKRTICAAPFHDRVLQHAIMNVCHNYFDRTLINTTFATRRGKGVYAALEMAIDTLSHYNYSVKLDFRKYYDSIDHKVLKCMLRRMFKDAKLLNLFDKIIDSYCTAEGKGLPIGNLTSQYFANLYLSGLDHKSQEEWKATKYIRYMDDILIGGNDRSTLKNCTKKMIEYSSSVLKLTLKPPIFKNSIHGQTFLGYKILPYHCKLSGRSKKRFRSKLLKYNKLLENMMWTERQYAEHIEPLISFVRHADSKAFREDCLKKQKVVIEEWV